MGQQKKNVKPGQNVWWAMVIRLPRGWPQPGWPRTMLTANLGFSKPQPGAVQLERLCPVA